MRSCLCLCESADSSCKPPLLSQTHISFSNTGPCMSDAGRIVYTCSACDCTLGFVLLLCCFNLAFPDQTFQASMVHAIVY